MDSTDWRITLAPAGAGTQIVQAFQLTKCPRWWEWIVARVNPPHIDRSAALTDDLHRIAALAAADARAATAAADADHRGDGAAAGTVDQQGRLR